MTATGLACSSCGTELRAGDKFCHECAAPVVGATTPAEYKQVTVLFADVLRPDDRAVREIEDALRNAERSADDLALAYARMTLGHALVHRQTATECDRGQKLLADVAKRFYAGDTTRPSYRSSRSSWHVIGLGVEIAMTPYR